MATISAYEVLQQCDSMKTASSTVIAYSPKSSWRSSTAFITFVISYAVFTEQFLFAVVVPVGPFALKTRVGIPEDQVQYWVACLLAVYGAAQFVSSPPWGWWTDRRPSRRVPFLIGLFWLWGATLLLWFANSKALLIVSRALQGVATTVIWTTGLAILVDTVGEAHIGEYMGYTALALNLGTLIGPVLGGIVFNKAGYNAVFGMACGVIGLDVVLRLVMAEREPVPRDLPQIAVTGDVEQASTTVSSAASSQEKHLSMISTTSEYEMPTSRAPTPAMSEANLLAPEVEGPKPWYQSLLPFITLLFSAHFLAILWGIVMQAVIYSRLLAVLPLGLHDIFGWDSTGTGLIFIPLIAPGLLGPLVGKMSDRSGPRWFATIGFVGLCVSLILMRLITHDDLAHKAGLCVLLAAIGLFSCFTLEPLAAEITTLGGKKCSYAQAYALFNMAWSLGDIIGPLLAAPLMGKMKWDRMSLVIGLMSGVTAVPVALWCGGWYFARQR